MNKKLLVSQMKLVFEFNERNTSTSKDFKPWQGRVLVITSEDDPEYEDDGGFPGKALTESWIL